MSRSVITNLFYSIDGVAADPYLFQFDSFDSDLGEWVTRAMNRVDDVVLGRTTYTEWAEHWPTVTAGEDTSFADFINAVPKHVASRSLTSTDLKWAGSRLIEGDPVDYVRRLKQGSGGAIAVQGSISVVRQLVAAGLLDELNLCIHPAVAGAGRHLFDDADPVRLRLRDVRGTEKGNVLVSYGPRDH